ncbi:MAG: ABC transporter ATP-binding protein [Clostridiales bacterium]|nr:ABC transporter ATP-binding protein [Clostridiales bacterium]MBQ2156541.1 ABC transporter ATP-binding protein [Clostridiales bacterium]MBQ4217490.1 ABC transporter ATP-binding protein [Clostridiales bacterium]
MADSIVTVEKVSLKYKKTVLTDVTITAQKGEVVGLLGLNGSGKSTLLSAIAGLRKTHSGTIRVEGKAGFVTQENALIDELSAMDNLKMWTPLSKAEIMKALTETELSILKVNDFIDLKVKRMSGGMKKRLAIASVLLSKPDILLLDEPLAALDIPAKNDIIKFIDSFRAKGGTVFIASHSEEMFKHCSKIYLLKNGVSTLLPAGISPAEALG